MENHIFLQTNVLKTEDSYLHSLEMGILTKEEIKSEWLPNCLYDIE